MAITLQWMERFSNNCTNVNINEQVCHTQESRPCLKGHGHTQVSTIWLVQATTWQLMEIYSLNIAEAVSCSAYQPSFCQLFQVLTLPWIRRLFNNLSLMSTAIRVCVTHKNQDPASYVKVILNKTECNFSSSIQGPYIHHLL